MKHPILVFGGVLVSASLLVPISSPAQRVDAGIEIGRVWSNYSAQLTPTVGNPYVERMGWRIGIGAELQVFQILSLAASLGYVQKGALTTEPFYYAVRSGHLELPLLVRVKFPVGPLRPFGEVGLAPSLEIGCSRKSYMETLPCPSKKLDTEAILGAGIQAVIKRMTVTAELRRGWGLRNLTDGERTYIRSRTLSLLLRVSRGP